MSKSEDDDDARLPQIMEGETAEKRGITPEQHFTQPPPRYTEATLVKRMEELGIGRPSTYASIVTTIQDRGYVLKDKGRLIPEDKGRLVTAFLENYFRKYVGYEFTANLEEELDDITNGTRDWQDVLARFWRDFSAALAETSDLRIGEVLEKINEVLEPHLFPPTEDGSDPRLCPNCGQGRLSMRTARSGGAFIGCSNYPECRYTRPFGPPGMDDGDAIGPDGKLLGEDAGDEIRLMNGRFGPYVQRGEPTEEAPKPPRASLPKGWTPEDMTLEKALTLLSLPREIGPHPEDGEMVEAGIGRYGPYVKHGRLYANLPEVEEVFTIGMNRAVEVLAQKAAGRGGRGRAAAKPLKDLGEHPAKGGAVAVMEGKLRALRQMGQGQRDPAQGHRPGGGDDGHGGRTDRREGREGRQEDGGEEGRPEEGGEETGRQEARSEEKGPGTQGVLRERPAGAGSLRPGRSKPFASRPSGLLQRGASLTAVVEDVKTVPTDPEEPHEESLWLCRRGAARRSARRHADRGGRLWPLRHPRAPDRGDHGSRASRI